MQRNDLRCGLRLLVDWRRRSLTADSICGFHIALISWIGFFGLFFGRMVPQALYTALAERLWDPDRLERDAGPAAASVGAHEQAAPAHTDPL